MLCFISAYEIGHPKSSTIETEKHKLNYKIAEVLFLVSFCNRQPRTQFTKVNSIFVLFKSALTQFAGLFSISMRFIFDLCHELLTRHAYL